MSKEGEQSRAEIKALQFQRKFGVQSAASGRYVRPKDVIPTGILALDYALGTGGWTSGSIIEVFGVPDVGKSVLALMGCCEAQKLGKLCGWIALEPGYDSNWAQKFGVNPDELIVAWPDNGLDAFNQLQMMVNDDDIEFIVFDSIGGVLRPSETEEDAKPSQGGQAALISWGVKRAVMTAFKKNKYIIFLNQVRDDMNSRYPGTLDSPGGHTLKHESEIRIQLKPSTVYNLGSGDDKILVGREIIAEIKRSKRTEGTNIRAVYDFYQKDSKLGKLGIDMVTDVLNTAKRTNVIEQKGAYYHNDLFPEGRIYTKDNLEIWLRENPDGYAKIREQVLAAL